ncbi:cytochrome P450 2D6 [Gastrophryne carolinensis]
MVNLDLQDTYLHFAILVAHRKYLRFAVQLGQEMHYQLAKEYGDVFRVQYFWQNMVVLNGYEVLKEALLQKSEDIADRPMFPLFESLGISGNAKGVSLAHYGRAWQEQRRFSLTTLRDFGMGKKTLEARVIEEAEFLCAEFHSQQGQPFDPHYSVNTAVSNIISSIMFGDRFEYNDETFNKLLQIFEDALKAEGGFMAQVLSAIPCLCRIPGLPQRIFKPQVQMSAYMKEMVLEQRDTWNPTYTRHFIDAFLLEMEKTKDDKESSFNEGNLVTTPIDMFTAGIETTTTTLRWAILFMLLYPDVQRKVQKEIDEVIGRSRNPTMADVLKMPYTNAVIHEVQRCGDIFPVAMHHMTFRDTEIGGYFIPKGIIVVLNLSSVLKDEQIWEKPYQFYPDHFLGPDGKFMKKDAFMAFAAGRRACPGEHLARMELFIFLTTLLQSYTFEIPDKMPPPKADPVLAVTLCPQPYKVCAIARNFPKQNRLIYMLDVVIRIVCHAPLRESRKLSELLKYVGNHQSRILPWGAAKETEIVSMIRELKDFSAAVTQKMREFAPVCLLDTGGAMWEQFSLCLGRVFKYFRLTIYQEPQFSGTEEGKPHPSVQQVLAYWRKLSHFLRDCSREVLKYQDLVSIYSDILLLPVGGEYGFLA